MREIHANFGVVEGPSAPEEFERRSRGEGPVWISIVRELGVTLDWRLRPWARLRFGAKGCNIRITRTRARLP